MMSYSPEISLTDKKWKRYPSLETSPAESPKCHKTFGDEWRDITNISNLNKDVTLDHTDDQKVLQTIEEVSQKLLVCNDFYEPPVQFVRQLKKLMYSYKNVTEDFSSKLDNWSELRERNINSIQSTLQKFSFLEKTASGITLASSAIEFLVGLGTVMDKLFQFHMSPRYYLLVQLVGGLSITYSFSALMYSNNAVEDLVRELRDEKYLLRDIEIVYRRGNWIDKDLQDLFPHSIDLKLVAKMVFDADGNLLDAWQQRVCTAIILSNVKKDEKLLHDDEFLASVKAFVGSTAAQIWIKRMKLRSLLDDMTKNIENLPDKKVINGNEVFLNLAGINLYPLFFSFLSDSRRLKETKFAFSCLAGVSTALSLLDSADGFENMKATSTKLQKDYRHIKKMTQDLLRDYD